MSIQTATAQASPNIAFIKYRLAKFGRTNRKVYYGENLAFEIINSTPAKFPKAPGTPKSRPLTTAIRRYL